VSYRTNDNPLACGRPFKRIEHSVVSNSRRPSPGEPPDEWLADDVGLDGKVSQGVQHCVTER
jgi:hypothetical protein